MPNDRDERLAEVVKLSRKPMQRLHANLLDVVIGAMDQLKQDDWVALAKKAPDRIIQGLTMTARMAGYGDKLEYQVSGHLDLAERISAMSDSEKDAMLVRYIEDDAPAMFAALADALPAALGTHLRAQPDDVKQRVYRAMAMSVCGPTRR